MYNVPRQTLQQYLLKNEFRVPKLDRKSDIGVEAEDDLEKYLILGQEYGFGLTRSELKNLAFDSIEKLEGDDVFNDVNKMAGDIFEWYGHILSYKYILTVWKEENLLINTALGSNRSNEKFFEILENKMTQC
ncbi:hypothetical protein TNCT_320671 [Trichonephila clavata]|uniref:Uncharacterized protein n=1 Tax=Trichonephila clavata TaxID=2740835 RepID=A0A8X6LSU5_TRICU|nr:hypothetical protein TNCT_320671 [Trichonephila clavata]